MTTPANKSSSHVFGFFFEKPEVKLSSTGSFTLPDGRRYTDPDWLVRQ